MGAGAQPNGLLEDRLAATLKQYVVVVDDNQSGYYTGSKRYSRDLTTLKVIPVAGVQINITRADARSWEARISHPETRLVCVIGRTAHENSIQLEPATAARYCSTSAR